MAYPTYRQDFEGGSTLATACPELVDLNSAFGIDTSGANSFTGTHALKLAKLGSNYSVVSSAADTLGGDITVSGYFKLGANSPDNPQAFVYAQCAPLQGFSSFLRGGFDQTGNTILQYISGSGTYLNTKLSGVMNLDGVWICLELRCHGTTISTRVVRQDTGQFFVQSGTGSWSSTPQVQTGTATLAESAGGFGITAGNSSYAYVDDLIYEPAVLSIDHATFTVTGSATQQLTAGGFTDPLFGVTWSSSNTAVATVNSAGLVTGVSAGTATITATGKRDTGQTATATVTVTPTSATSYTLTTPTPDSGYTNNPSGNFTLTPNGLYTGSITITPSGGGLSSPITLNWTASSAAQTFSITPTASGTVTHTPTNSGTLSNATPVTYPVSAQSLLVNPSIFYASTPVTANISGVGTRWTTSAPSIALTGTAATGTTIGSLAVVSDTSATALITTGTTAGPLIFHDSTTSAMAPASVASAPTTWSYMSSVAGFTSGLAGSVGYTVLHSDGSTYAARTTSGVFAVGSAGYAALVPLPMSGSYAILWDDGSSHFAFEVVSPSGVEPPSMAVPGGINQSQCLSEILAAVSGLASGFVGSGSSNPQFMAPDGTTVRIVGTVDQMGNRSGLTLSPPL